MNAEGERSAQRPAGPVPWTEGVSVTGLGSAKAVLEKEREVQYSTASRASAAHSAVAAPEELLLVKDLSVDVRVNGSVARPVDGVSLSVSRGSTLAIVGESGSGKSLTAMAIAGLLPRNAWIGSGSVTLNGVRMDTLSERERTAMLGSKIGVIFQDPMSGLDPVRSIQYQVGEPFRRHLRLGRDETQQRVRALLRQVELPESVVMNKCYPHELSGGMRQRVMIAMAISRSPALLIADEPTTALDVTIQLQILRLLYRLTKDLRAGLILITHDMGVVAGIADHVQVMYAGQVVEEGPVNDVMSAPEHPYTEALMACSPSLTGTDRESPLPAISGNPLPLHMYSTGCRFAPRCPYANLDACASSPGPLRETVPGHKVRSTHPTTERRVKKEVTYADGH